MDETNLGGDGAAAQGDEKGNAPHDCGMCDDPYHRDFIKPWHNGVWNSIFDISVLDEATSPEIMQIESQGNWEKIEVCPDSGAVKFVAPVQMASHIPWKAGAASKAGVKYRVANGNLIPNVGEKVVKGKDVNGNPLTSTWQGAPVTKPLAGIKEMVRAKNRVVFDEDESGRDISYIHNKVTRVTIPINDKPSGYSFDMWVPRSGGDSKGEWAEVKNGGSIRSVNGVTSQGVTIGDYPVLEKRSQGSRKQEAKEARNRGSRFRVMESIGEEEETEDEMPELFGKDLGFARQA